MLVQNISTEEELINGSRGVVERFALVPVVRDFKGEEERMLAPEDYDKFPGYSFEQLKFGMTLDFDGKTWKIYKFAKYPLVRFLNHRSRIILPTTFERTMFRQGTCTRLQLPLRLSWALTIHKAQGCTLDWLICDLSGCFTAGQAYVALSRAKTMAGLQIRNFSAHAVLTNPLVDGFYQALASNTISSFLRDQAGLWWYPILEHKEWRDMFCEASPTVKARENSAQFSMWVANYAPSSDYRGWKGHDERTFRTSSRSSTTVSPTPDLALSSNSRASQEQLRTVTPSVQQFPCVT